MYIIYSRTQCHSAMHNNLNILELKPVLELQSFIPNANRLNIWQLNNLSHQLKGTNIYPQPTPNFGPSCEKVTGSNVIKVLVTDNVTSRLDSPFCVITQHRKFEFGYHRQSKKIRNAKELTLQLSQTLSSAIAQIKVSNSPITNHTKKILPQRPPPFFNFCIT